MTALTTALDCTSFVSLVTGFISKREISRLNAASDFGFYRLERVLENVSRYAKYNEEDGIPVCYRETCYGISWSVNTGRLNAETVIALKAMKVRALLILIHKVQTHCTVIGQVPEYLMSLNLTPSSQ